MDFLDIRKKAKERAQARAAEDAARRERNRVENAPAPDPVPRAGEPRRRRTDAPPVLPAPGPVTADEDAIGGALAARLQGLPPAGAAPPAALAADDARFTTWRPGAGAPPVLAQDLDDGAPGPLVGAGQLATFAPLRRVTPDLDARPSAPPAPAAPRDPLDDFFYRPDEAAPALPQLAPAAAQPDEPPLLLAREEYLTFLLGPEEYAVAIERVREVIRAPPITEVPRAPGHILGVVTVRGEVIAVVDPRRRLGLPLVALAEGEGKVVIVDAGEGSCGVLVDRVASVVRLRPGSIEPCPQGIAGQRSEFLAGIGRDGDRLFTLIDLAALLRRFPERAEAPVGARRADAGA